MKPLTLVEVKNCCEILQALVGAQLQEVISHDRGLALGFYLDQNLNYLLIDLTAAHPGLFLFETIPFWIKSLRPKPVGLFLNSHGKNLVLRELKLDEDLGRVVRLKLANSTDVCELECVLIPKQPNLTVQSFEIQNHKKTFKKISWEKPRELSPSPTDFEKSEPRDFSQIHEEWLQTFDLKKSTSVDPEAQWLKKKEQQISKKQKALGEIEKEINSDKTEKWQALGELMKTHQIEELLPEWKAWIDSKMNLKENRERAFQKSKQVRLKRTGQLQRIEILQKEISQLQASEFNPEEVRARQQKARVDLLHKTEAAGRTRKLASGAMAYMGKSATDNLRILRAAKSWDFWLHLRDYPGAHAIIHKEKNQIISEEELREVALWVADETLSKKSLALGQRLNVILVECRFVRPIKGDHHGRVNYHDERNLVVNYEKK